METMDEILLQPVGVVKNSITDKESTMGGRIFAQIYS